MENSHFPTEEEQFEVYKEAVTKAKGELIIRTLDIGGDKFSLYYMNFCRNLPSQGYKILFEKLDLVGGDKQVIW